MAKQVTWPSLEELLLGNEQSWRDLYSLLRSPVTLFVHVYAPPTWIGQEQDFIEDILQETVMRIYKALLLAMPIRNLEPFCLSVARNYCRDLRRKDRRLLHFPHDTYTFDARIHPWVSEDLLEITLDELTAKAILAEVVHLIAALPEKRRTALLIDLARHNDFEGEPTEIQLALAQVGISLPNYRDWHPADSAERTRHNALVSLAYRGLKLTFRTEYSDIVIAS